MPSEKVLEQKKAMVAAIAEQLKTSCIGVIVDYKGISVAEDTALRKELREAGVKYSVVKNTLLGFAAKEVGLEGLDDVLNGTTAIATCEEDYTAAPRILGKFADGDTINALAKLPTRDVLLATVLGAFNAPIAAFARAVQAIVDKDGEPATEETAAE